MCTEPPLPPHWPSPAAEDLLHHRLDVAALGDAVAVAAMGRGDVILLTEVHADADRGGLLTGVEMDEARDLAGGEFVMYPILELPDRAHPSIGQEQIVSTHLKHGWVPPSWCF